MVEKKVCPQGHEWEGADQESCPRCGARFTSVLLSGGADREETAASASLWPSPPPPPIPFRSRPSTSLDAASPLPSIANFEIVKELGHGGMGVVFLARHTVLDRLVALKMIRAGSWAGAEELQRFRTEAQAVAHLQHPGIVQIFEIGEHEQLPYFALEYVEGGSLDKVIGGNALPARAAAMLVQRLAEAMQAAHEGNIVHRDLKPANVLLARSDAGHGVFLDRLGRPGHYQPKITDFGLAKRLDVADGGQTQSGAILGTPGYMPPEQASGSSKGSGPAGDVYALGAILYELLTGRPPFKAQTTLDTLTLVLTEDPVAPSRLEPSVARDLETICLKCLRKEPPRRYASAAELAADLGRFLAGEPIQARPVGRIERLWRWCRRKPAVAALWATGVLALVILAALAWWDERRLQQAHARTLVSALDSADTTDVPRLVEQLAHYRRWADPLLAKALEAIKDDAQQAKKNLHLRLALLPVDESQVSDLAGRLLTGTAAECLVIRDALRRHRHDLLKRLWSVLADPKGNGPQRLRAAAALADYDAAHDQWDKVGEAIAQEMVSGSALELEMWAKALTPVRRVLLEPLKRVQADAARSSAQRSLATTLLAEYASDRPDWLADVVLDAEPWQFAILWPKVRAHPAAYRARMEQELGRTLAPAWPDPPARTNWPSATPDLIAQIQDAHGMLSGDFAFCLSLPLTEFAALSSRLQQCGYRPTRLRPFAKAKQLHVAAVWTRDGEDWQATTNLTEGEVVERDEQLRGQGFQPVDLAACALDSVRFAALWVRAKNSLPARLYAADQHDHDDVWQKLWKGDFFPQTYQVFETRDGRQRHCAVWTQMPQDLEGAWSAFAARQSVYEAKLTQPNVQMDVCLGPPPQAQTGRELWEARRKETQHQLERAPHDLGTRLRHAHACFALGKDDDAIAGYSRLLESQPMPEACFFRALARARRGQGELASQDMLEFRQRSKSVSKKGCLQAALAFFRGDASAALAQVEALVTKHGHNADFCYDAAWVYALAAQAGPADQSPKREQRALQLLEQAFANGALEPMLVQHDSYLRFCHDPLLATLGTGPHLQRFATQIETPVVASVWYGNALVESREIHGADMARHLEQAKRLAEQGFRPVSVSVCASGRGVSPLASEFLAASVWHRPVVSDEAKDRLAARQAQAAAVLALLGASDKVWPLLRHQPEPRLRTFLMHRLAALQVPADLLLRCWQAEQNTSARRALLLALGDYSEAQFPLAERRRFADALLEVYRRDPDGGLHAAAEWLLRQWQLDAPLAAIDKELARAGMPGQTSKTNAGWYLTPAGHTLAIIRGPVDFRMGSPPSEPHRITTEGHFHRRIEHSFALGAKEITVRQFLDFLQENPGIGHQYAKRYGPHQDGPMISVTWYEAAQYCRWLGEKEGLPESEQCYPPIPEIKEGMKLPADFLKRRGYRLPTEMEWEYACRAEATTSRFFGSSPEMLAHFGWYHNNAQERTWPVGRKKPNDFGLFDVYGNVWEWCHDASISYRTGLGRLREDSPRETVVSNAYSRVVRGGAFLILSSDVRSARRFRYEPDFRFLTLGFRVARTL